MQEENGYWFVLTEYENGRCGYTERRYKTKLSAQRRAKIIRQRQGIKTAKVCYQCGVKPIDIKKFI